MGGAIVRDRASGAGLSSFFWIPRHLLSVFYRNLLPILVKEMYHLRFGNSIARCIFIQTTSAMGFYGRRTSTIDKRTKETHEHTSAQDV